MKRRVICALLAALILISLIPAAFTVSAASNMKTSEDAIAVLKELEGFTPKPIPDSGQYSVGYGSSCGKDDYPNGITEEEADLLLRERLEVMEASVNAFAVKYGLSLKQNQFDALMLFTYNCGTGWTKTDSDFRQAVIDGATGNDFLYYISRWSTVDSAVRVSLVKRRLAEADMYLYGTYEKTPPSSYTYVLFNAADGTCDSKVQGYDASQPVAVKPVPVRTGYRFLGWYTSAAGGRWVTMLDSKTVGLTLYAHWQAEEDASEDGQILGTAANYTRSVAGEALNIYSAPGAAGEATDKVKAGTEVKITADYVDGSGTKWGKLSDGGWIDLSGTEANVTAAAAPVRNVQATVTVGVTVTVTGTNVNIRSGAGTNYPSQGQAELGRKIVITQTVQDGDRKWGKFSDGWICLLYTDYDQVVEQNSAASETVTATGVIVNCDKLRIRAGAGTNYDCVGTLPVGTKVEITQQKNVGDYVWGKISSGWIRLDYVQLTAVEETPEETVPEETTPAETEPEETTPEQPKEDKEETSTVTGTVTASALNIRSGAGNSYPVQGLLEKGAVVTILEQKSQGSTSWGRIDKGWICLNYVKLSTSAEDNSGTAGGSSSGSTTETTKTTGTVKVSGYLNVRSAAGTGNKAVGKLSNGTKVEILSTTKVNGVTWGQISSGWISMQYVVLDSSSSGNSGSTATETTTGTVTADALRIRSGAGTDKKVVGVYYQGQKVTILEKTTVNGVSWGRTSKGWICLDYVK